MLEFLISVGNLLPAYRHCLTGSVRQHTCFGAFVYLLSAFIINRLELCRFVAVSFDLLSLQQVKSITLAKKSLSGTLLACVPASNNNNYYSNFDSDDTSPVVMHPCV